MFMRIMSLLQSRRAPLDRRFALMASVAAIAAVMVIARPDADFALAAPQGAPAQPAERSGPPSFAAIVQSVKPAVISVRAKVTETNSEDMSSQDNEHGQRRPPFFRRPPFDRFFREFGVPNFPDGGSRA